MAYMTADELRDRIAALRDDADITDEMLEDLVEEFEDIAERYNGVAYEPREATVTVDVCGRRWVTEHQKITAVDDIELDDVAVTGYTFADGYAIDFGTHRRGTLVITYTHGFASPPKPILRACREYVRACALADRSRTPRDAYLQQGDGITFRLVTPNWEKRQPTGYIEVDRLLNSVTNYRKPAAF